MSAILVFEGGGDRCPGEGANVLLSALRPTGRQSYCTSRQLSTPARRDPPAQVHRRSSFPPTVSSFYCARLDPSAPHCSDIGLVTRAQACRIPYRPTPLSFVEDIHSTNELFDAVDFTNQGQEAMADLL